MCAVAPGTQYGVIGQLQNGATATVRGKSADGAWWQIDYASASTGVGWVNSSVVQPNSAAASVAGGDASAHFHRSAGDGTTRHGHFGGGYGHTCPNQPPVRFQHARMDGQGLALSLLRGQGAYLV